METPVKPTSPNRRESAQRSQGEAVRGGHVGPRSFFNPVYPPAHYSRPLAATELKRPRGAGVGGSAVSSLPID